MPCGGPKKIRSERESEAQARTSVKARGWWGGGKEGDVRSGEAVFSQWKGHRYKLASDVDKMNSVSFENFKNILAIYLSRTITYLLRLVLVHVTHTLLR